MMKKNMMYSFILLVAIVLLTACGTDQKENPVSVGPYSFENATTPLKIVYATDINGTLIGTHVVRVQLLEFGLVKPGEEIQMKPFDFQYGFVTNSVVITDQNGYAEFTYNFPDNYNKIKGQDIIIEAVFLDPNQIINQPAGTGPVKRTVLLTQEFVLQFR